MKKFVATLLALMLMVTCVACTNNMTSAEFKTEFEKFDWENSAPTAVSMEAERLLGIYEDLPSEEKQELSDVKAKLDEYKKGEGEKDEMVPDETQMPNATDMPEETDMPEMTDSPDDLMEEMRPEEGGIIDEMMPEGDLKDDIMGRDMHRGMRR